MKSRARSTLEGIGTCRAVWVGTRARVGYVTFDAQLRKAYLSLQCTLYVRLCMHMLYAGDYVSSRSVLVIWVHMIRNTRACRHLCLRVALKSTKEELHRFYLLLANTRGLTQNSQATLFVAYKRFLASLFSGPMCGALHKYTMDPNYALLEEDRIFWLYIDACQVNASYDVLNITEELALIESFTSKVTTPQNAHGRLVLQVYLGFTKKKFTAT